MGRKTNSVSLRLNTNKDPRNSWYGDILYEYSFSKFLQIQHLLNHNSYTLLHPYPQISYIGAYKKANLLVCYLDPKSRIKRGESLNLKLSSKKDASDLYKNEPFLPLSKEVVEKETVVYGVPPKGVCTKSDVRCQQSVALWAKDQRPHIQGGEKIYKKKNLLLFLESIKKGHTTFFNSSLSFLFKEENLQSRVHGSSDPLFLKKNNGYKGPLGLGKNKELFFYKEKIREIFVSTFPKASPKKVDALSYSASRSPIPFRKEQIFLSISQILPLYLSPLLYKRDTLYKKKEFVFFGPKDEQKHMEYFYEKYKVAGKKAVLWDLYNSLSCFWENVVGLSFIKSNNEKASAIFLAQTFSYFLEHKVLFRRIKRQLETELSTKSMDRRMEMETSTSSIQRIAQKGSGTITDPLSSLSQNIYEIFSTCLKNKSQIAGIRVESSGRVTTQSKKAQRSRKEKLMWGETGLHVFSSKLDFAKTHAETPFGVVGIKVWICYK